MYNQIDQQVIVASNIIIGFSDQTKTLKANSQKDFECCRVGGYLTQLVCNPKLLVQSSIQRKYDHCLNCDKRTLSHCLAKRVESKT
jgi:hypothetical protein